MARPLATHLAIVFRNAPGLIRSLSRSTVLTLNAKAATVTDLGEFTAIAAAHLGGLRFPPRRPLPSRRPERSGAAATAMGAAVAATEASRRPDRSPRVGTRSTARTTGSRSRHAAPTSRLAADPTGGTTGPTTHTGMRSTMRRSTRRTGERLPYKGALTDSGSSRHTSVLRETGFRPGPSPVRGILSGRSRSENAWAREEAEKDEEAVDRRRGSHGRRGHC
jgi:hypothetical protein